MPLCITPFVNILSFTPPNSGQRLPLQALLRQKRRFWLCLGQLVRDILPKARRGKHVDLNSQVTQRHRLDRCVIVQVTDDASNYFYKESGGYLQAITRTQARTLLTHDLDCKLLCDYVKTRCQGDENWWLKLSIFLDDVRKPDPRYFVEFLEYSDKPPAIQELGANISIQVDTEGPFGLKWNLSITRNSPHGDF
jgi:hypothetical protein